MYLLNAEINEGLNNLPVALEMRKLYETLNDSLVNAETQSNIHKLEIEYQVTEKEKAIALQDLTIAQNNLELQAKNKWIVLGFSSTILILIIFTLSYILYLNKQKTIKEQLKLVEKEKEVQVLEARIEGEEKERSRLARELHDGVGGIISATKMHLSIARNELGNSKLDHTVSLLDSAAQEIRSIAHNLDPESLIKHGLRDAVALFCKKVSSERLNIEYYAMGDLPALKTNFQVSIYRIVQELVNNIIKHSGASGAIVQMSCYENFLTLTVEDNGIGMRLSGSSGIGLSNLQARVRALNGQIEIASTENSGTTVNLEFELNQYNCEETPQLVT